MRKKSRIGIAIATYNRAKFLSRSLDKYLIEATKRNCPEIELYILDDDSTDETLDVINRYKKMAPEKLLVNVETLKKNGEWRDSASIINIAIDKLAHCDIIIATHPEILIGETTLQTIAIYCEMGIDYYYSAKPFFLNVEDQKILDNYNWRNKITSILDIDGYLDRPKMLGYPDYSPKMQLMRNEWESWVFGGMSSNLWQKIGGLPKFTAWGSVDVVFREIRQRHNIQTLVLPNNGDFVIHQNHDDVMTINGKNMRDEKKM